MSPLGEAPTSAALPQNDVSDPLGVAIEGGRTTPDAICPSDDAPNGAVSTTEGIVVVTKENAAGTTLLTTTAELGTEESRSDISGGGPRRKRSLDRPRSNRPSPRQGKRRSRRGNSSLSILAEHIVSGRNVVVVTGAGLSVGSGIRPFRGDDGLWGEVVWRKATREEFRRDPLDWYNSFWLPYFPPHTYIDHHEPNAGHEALARIASLPNTNVRVITQNVDGLHSCTKHPWDHDNRLIEAHGRLGLYKCLPESDSDTDSDSDEDEGRPVKLGSRRKSRALRRAVRRASKKHAGGVPSLDPENGGSDHAENKLSDAPPTPCKYEVEESIPGTLLEPESTRRILCAEEKAESCVQGSCNDVSVAPMQQNATEKDLKRERISRKRDKKRRGSLSLIDNEKTLRIKSPPLCPSCRRPCPPQALLFDEGYHSHAHYQFERMEEWIAASGVIVFVGTSFSVTVTDVALEYARENQVPVFNFNINAESGVLESTVRLNVENVLGDVSETLPMLLKTCEQELAQK